ncbi:MAG: LamG-like jellyroll fold domain-containing protein, partial [Bacteroidota bacterium]
MEKIRKTTFTLLLSTIFSLPLLAQEDCDNGIDDDGDGFVDCFDSECSGGSSCSDFFFGNSVVCQDEPTSDPSFSIRVQWGSEDRTANSHAVPTVGDIDQDGTPEIVVSNKHAQHVSVLDGVTGNTEFQIPLSFQPENGIAIGDIDGDECAEIFVGEDRGNGDLAAFTCDGTELWSVVVGDKVGVLGLADFNGDGQAELYYGDEIRNALTGAVIVAESGNLEVDYTHGSMAIDILDDAECTDCAGMELITGNEIWAINITAGTKTLVRDMNDVLSAQGVTGRYHPKYYPNWGGENWSCVSVADYNQDGFVDVLLPGALGNDYRGTTTVFFWDVENETVVTYTDPTNNHPRGTGRINIADVDGDGQLNANYVSDQKLYSLDENFQPLWIKGIKEGSSGFTGCTLFDFDGDNAAETIYRSESQLLIIDGTDGSTRNTAPCISRTQEEYPIVADVDGDAASEICVTCYTSDNLSFNPYSNSEFAQVRIFESNGEVWQPSRTVWNQHGYYNVNVDDDLRIPAQQQDHTAVFGSDCDDGSADNRPLNTFLTQSTILEADGCPSFVSPDINLISINDAGSSFCPETEFDVTFELRNDGDTDLSGTLPVAFYNGDPRTPDAELVDTDIYILNNFTVGSTETVTMTVDGPGGDFDLYILINDAGSEPPVVITTASIPECETGNNLATRAVESVPFELQTQIVSDNEKCTDDAPDNGEATAYYEGTLGGGTETVYFENFEDLGNGTTEDTGLTAWTRTEANNTDLAAVSSRLGTKAFEANDTDGNVNWRSAELDISTFDDVAFSVDLTASGNMENNQDDVRVYMIVDGTETQIARHRGSFGFENVTQTGINGSTLQIRVRMRNTANNERYYLDNVLVTGTTEERTGQFTEADGFTFEWYDENFLNLLYEGSSYNGMADGTYLVRGFYASGNCYSEIDTVVIQRRTPGTFTVETVSTTDLTNCVTPNGAASVQIMEAGGGTTTAGYTFTWFDSDDTSTPIATGASLTSANAGTYIVQALHLATGCTEQGSVEIGTSLAPTDAPQLVSVSDVSSCSDPNSGSIEVNVGGQVDGILFEWYDGEVAVGTPDFSGTGAAGATYANLGVGTYTVTATDGTGCESAPLSVPVGSSVVFPNPKIETTPNTSCATFNGTAIADGDSANTVTGYDFEWYAGSNTLAENRLPGAISGSSLSNEDSQANGLPGGPYTLVVTNEATGCETLREFTVEETFEIPAFETTRNVDTDESVQFGTSGFIEIPQMFGTGTGVAGAPTNGLTISYWANFTQTNYDNDHRVFSSGSTGEGQVLLWSDNHNGLAFVVRTSSGGRGRINSSYQTNGWTYVTGTWDGTTGDMRLYANGVEIGASNHVGSGILINTGNTMKIGQDNNPGYGKFTGIMDEVRVYNRALSADSILAHMCMELTGNEEGLVGYWDFNNITGTTVPNMANGLATPSTFDGTIQNTGDVSFQQADITCSEAGNDNRTCDASNPNGSIDASEFITPRDTAADISYTYTLYSGFGTATAITSNTTGLFESLAGGFYTVSAVDNASGCETTPVPVSIADVPDNPSIVAPTTKNTNCGTPGNGTIAVTASSSTEPVSYRFRLYDINGTPNLLQTETVTVGSTGFTFTGLEQGNYRVDVRNNDILCESQLNVTIQDSLALPTISVTSNNNASCDTPSGSATVDVAEDATFGETNHTFRWYYGDVVDADSLITGQTAYTITGLGETNYNGTKPVGQNSYTVVAVNNATGCESEPETIFIFDEPYTPTITINETPSNDCGSGVGTGVLAAFASQADQVDGGGDPILFDDSDPNYTFRWFQGSDTTGTFVASTSTISNRTSGTYTVSVGNGSGCIAVRTYTLNSTPVYPTIALRSSANKTNCSTTTQNGAIAVDVSFDGVSPVTNLTGYTFEWYQGADATGTALADNDFAAGTPAGAATDSIGGLSGGQYTVVVTAPTGCGSAEQTFSIIDDPNLPTATLSAIGAGSMDNTVCDTTFITDGSTFDGVIDITPGTGLDSDYNFSWFYGQSTNIADDLLTRLPDATITNSGTTVNNIPGNVTFTVIMQSIANACADTLEFAIGNDPSADPTFASADATVANVTVCTGSSDYPNGAVTVNQVNGSTDLSDFYFLWWSGADTTSGTFLSTSAGDSTNAFTGLASDDYTIIAVDGNTGCTSAPVTVFVDEIPDLPSATKDSETANTVCDPDFANGGTYDGVLNVATENATNT